MNENSHFITITVDGVDSEHGHVRADELLDGLSHLLTALNGIDRLVGETGNPTLYYRVVEVSHSSPLSITFEPVARGNIKRIDTHHIERTHARFFRELRAIKLQQPVSPELDEHLLEHIRSLTSTAEPSFKTVTISNGHERVALDQQFESNIRKLIDEEMVSYGSVEGRLEHPRPAQNGP